jgi:NAD(P)-dependent dehydrogenase (short-subunit alcohol dehydrogenase family)
MLRQGAGHVVNITAAVADQPSSQRPALLTSLTKGGLNAATRALAIEYAACGIRVNAVAPAVIKTPQYPAESYQGLEAFIPLGRVGTVEDVVDAVLFLEAATFVTGEIIRVDGGRSAGI